MGGFSSKPAQVTPEPIPVTTTVPSTVSSTVPSTVHTTTTDFRPAEFRCSTDNHEILYMSLAFISGILVTVLVFAIISLFRKSYKRAHQNLQEETFSQVATEEFIRNTQNEVTYSTLVFQQGRTSLPV